MIQTETNRVHLIANLVLALVGLPLAALFAQIYRVAEMNTEQISALDRERTVVLLPGGILEQHGPYLPSFSDGYGNERLTEELANAIVAKPGWNVLIFPLIPLGGGGANEIGRKYVFDGTYAVRFSTLRAVFMDLATELGEAGFRWSFIIHGHGAPNHNRALDQAGDYFHDTYGGLMVHLLGLVPVGVTLDSILSEQARQDDGFSVHAGLYETSELLYLKPNFVDPKYKSADPFTGSNMSELVEIARRENWPGYFGAPHHANAAFGAAVWKAFSSEAIEYALNILDGLDPAQIPRRGDVYKKRPENVAIDRDALARDREVEKRQRAWLKKNGLEQ